MDYLDLKKQTRHNIILLVGYLCIAVAIAGTTIVLLYQAYGFGIGKDGTVIQNGLVFFSSQPNPANIYINGVLNNNQTDARISLPAGIYDVKITLNGYRDWQRSVQVDGGSVEHFDYPLLVPTKLVTKKMAGYSSAPGLMTQSPNRRWLVVAQPGSLTAFDLYDLNSPTTAPTSLTLPNTLLAKSTGPESWQFVDWADDNQHLLLLHTYNGGSKSEYILVDRNNPAQSINLTQSLSLADSVKLTLDNKKYNQYYLFDQTADTLATATLGGSAPAVELQHVLAYQSYSNDTILYATDAGASQGKVLVKLRQGSNTYIIHSFPAGTTYLLNLTQYSGTLYVAAGAASEGKVFIYQDPVGQLQAQPQQAVVPSQVLRVTNPNYLSFSDSAQFIAVESGQQFGVYDIENQIGHSYTTPLPIDTPQPHATWMDGDRLTYVSDGKLWIFDYDDANPRVLMPAAASYLPAFDPNYKYIYVLVPDPAAAGQYELTQTSLLATP